VAPSLEYLLHPHPTVFVLPSLSRYWGEVFAKPSSKVALRSLTHRYIAHQYDDLFLGSVDFVAVESEKH